MMQKLNELHFVTDIYSDCKNGRSPIQQHEISTRKYMYYDTTLLNNFKNHQTGGFDRDGNQFSTVKCLVGKTKLVNS